MKMQEFLVWVSKKTFIVKAVFAQQKSRERKKVSQKTSAFSLSLRHIPLTM